MTAPRASGRPVCMADKPPRPKAKANKDPAPAEPFAEAAERFRGRSVAQLPWATKIEVPGVMDLIEVADVLERFDALMRMPATITAP